MDECSLRPLVPYTDLLDIKRGRLLIKDKLDVPTNEFGVPQTPQLINDVLGTINADHYWQGRHDIHHVTWPGAHYRAVKTDDEQMLGALYRGSASLKVRLPRQLHNYIHRVTIEPRPPTIDVMRQWVAEQTQVDNLYNTVKLKNFSDRSDLSAEEQELSRQASLQYKLAKLSITSQLGLLPEVEKLHAMDISEARRVLRAISRVRGYSNSQKCQRKFFQDPLELAA